MRPWLRLGLVDVLHHNGSNNSSSGSRGAHGLWRGDVNPVSSVRGCGCGGFRSGGSGIGSCAAPGSTAGSCARAMRPVLRARARAAQLQLRQASKPPPPQARKVSSLSAAGSAYCCAHRGASTASPCYGTGAPTKQAKLPLPLRRPPPHLCAEQEGLPLRAAGMPPRAASLPAAGRAAACRGPPGPAKPPRTVGALFFSNAQLLRKGAAAARKSPPSKVWALSYRQPNSTKDRRASDSSSRARLAAFPSSPAAHPPHPRRCTSQAQSIVPCSAFRARRNDRRPARRFSLRRAASAQWLACRSSGSYRARPPRSIHQRRAPRLAKTRCVRPQRRCASERSEARLAARSAAACSAVGARAPAPWPAARAHSFASTNPPTNRYRKDCQLDSGQRAWTAEQTRKLAQAPASPYPACRAVRVASPLPHSARDRPP
eukprot:23157-Chlamydomonas_euryale.AAC.3